MEQGSISGMYLACMLILSRGQRSISSIFYPFWATKWRGEKEENGGWGKVSYGAYCVHNNQFGYWTGGI